MRLFIVIFLFPSLALAQELNTKATTYFNNKEWKKAIDAYSAYLEENKRDSSAWFNMGVSALNLQEYKSAIQHFNEALKINYPTAPAYYNKSKALTLTGDKSKALEALNSGAKSGLSNYVQLLKDTTFSSLQNEIEFKNILKQVKLNAYPCLSDENYRHFDFWLGEWDVFVNGNKVGENSITMARGGCALHENYTTSRNYAGQSINFFDPIDQKWHQHWVGSSGDVYNYLEIKKGEGMLQFESKFMNPNGQITLSRLTFTLNDDGSVRQFFENSTDKGKTWSAGFDGLYKRRF